MSKFLNSIDNLDKKENNSQKTYYSIRNLPSRPNYDQKINIKNKMEIIPSKISIEFSKMEEKIENNNENKKQEIIQNNLISDSLFKNSLQTINKYSNKKFSKNISYNTSETIVKCKPMISSTASKTFMKEYNISKRYQEDKLTLFPSIVEAKIIPEKEDFSFNNIKLSSSKKSEKSLNGEEDGEIAEDNDDEYKELLNFQERHLPVPLEQKDNEKFKILKIKEMKRLSMPSYKSVKKYGEDIEAQYEKDFRIRNAFSTLKKKKPVHSLRRLYSSSFLLKKNKKEEERFMIFRDKDIGIYEYWQAHIHHNHIDEDIETDEEQKITASNFSISEIKEAFDYIKQNGANSFVNFNKYEKFFNEKESQKIINQIITNLESFN